MVKRAGSSFAMASKKPAQSLSPLAKSARASLAGSTAALQIHIRDSRVILERVALEPNSTGHFSSESAELSSGRTAKNREISYV
jgi:hypothetical protein